MAKTKEQQAQEIIDSSTALLDKLKNTASKTPNRSRPKAPSKKRTAKTKTKQSAPPDIEPVAKAEIVHAPVSGAGINSTVRSDIKRTDPQTMAASLVAISEQQNTVMISQANKKLDKEVTIDQGLGLKVELEQEKNATIAESIQTQAMKTAQQSAKTSIEGVRLQGLNIDLAGEAALLPHREEGWAVKAEEMSIDNEGARSLLQPRREHWAAKLKLAQVGLEKLRIQIQQAQSELYAPLTITQLEN